MQDPRLKDFRNFLYLVWKHLGLPEPTPVQYEIAEWLQHGPKRKITMAFRGVGKSWITSAFVCWRLLMNPQEKILVVSASKSRADDFSTFTKRLIDELPELAHLRPRPGQRDSKVAFDVGPATPDHSPSVKSVGITGQLTGSRADLIVPDDVEVPSNALTQTQRDLLEERVKEFDSILKPGGEIAYLGTPQTDGSLYPKLAKKGYSIRIWPALFPDREYCHKYSDKISPKIIDRLEKDATLVGRSVDPKRFSEQDLRERELSLGRSTFALQFMLDTSLSDFNKYPLKLSDLIVMPLDPTQGPSRVVWSNSPEHIWNDLPCVGMSGDKYYRPFPLQQMEFQDYSGSVMYIDPSGRGKDETAVVVVKMINGLLFLTEMEAFQGGYSKEILTRLAYIAKAQKANHIQVEANFGDGMFSQLFKPILSSIYPCMIEDVKVSKQKELRIIDTLEPVLNSHKLIVDKRLIQKDYDSTLSYPSEIAHRYQLFWQLTHVTKEKGALVQDDRLDALAGAVAYWAQFLDQDVNKIIRQKQHDDRMAYLRKCLDDEDCNNSTEGNFIHGWKGSR